MNTPKSLTLALVFGSAIFFTKPVSAQEAAPAVVVLNEAGLPSADSPAFPQKQLEQALPGARFVSAEQLASLLTDSATRLLVLPYGSAFPEADLPALPPLPQPGLELLATA